MKTKPGTYETTIGPILEAAKNQGASLVFLTGGRAPHIKAGGDFFEPLEGHPPVRDSDLESFLQEFGFSGSLEGAFRFSGDRTPRGDSSVVFRRIPSADGAPDAACHPTEPSRKLP